MQPTEILSKSSGEDTVPTGSRALCSSLFMIGAVAVLLTLGGCDRAYRYMFFPPERVEYTLA
ncbi:hypothetical protein D4R75_01190, partial [bacterium]